VSGDRHNSATSSGRQSKGRASSEGQLRPLQHVEPRMAVSRAPQELLEKHPPIDSLLARARAPAPLPRYVAPPQPQSQIKYNPPARDAWEYDKVTFVRDVVQVARLENKPYVRKGAKELEEELTARRRRGKISGLSNIYGPLVQMKAKEREPQRRQPPRVHSLPALPAARSSPSCFTEVQALNHVSPQRLMALA